ncbi:MAG: tRNA threonylcarbamoyladenosine dehydratase [Oscillospiraceae bacterium]|nr:tRNA threonylcarbamoyladenosine dehydratase [Oscillospiraceae bacterium]
MNIFTRSEMLLGTGAMERLASARVAIFGVGGVGSFTAEALARTGVGHITLMDSDTVEQTNINRQLIALHSTIGKPKVEVMAQRIIDINPACNVTALQHFFNANMDFDFAAYDYIVDAVDTVTAKLGIVVRARAAGVAVISSMGAGNKLDPTKFQIADISKTHTCPLARVMRRELKARGVYKGVKVVFSTEDAVTPHFDLTPVASRRTVPGSIAFVPSVAGLIIASAVVIDLSKTGQQ